MKSEQTSRVKDRYKVRNWKAYNKSLVQRGEISIWLEASVMRARGMSEEEGGGGGAVPGLCDPVLSGVGEGVPPAVAADHGLREEPAELTGLRRIPGARTRVPDYSTLCRRQGSLPNEVLEEGRKLDIAIDSTKLKVYSEGEWKVCKHGASKRRVLSLKMFANCLQTKKGL